MLSTEVQDYEACDSIGDKFKDLPFSAENWGPIVLLNMGEGGGTK